MIEIVRWKPDGDPKTCHMPRYLYDVFLTKAKDIGFLVHHGKSECTSADSFEFLQPFVSFNTRKRDTIKPVFTKIIHTGGFLMPKVLDLEGVFKPVLSEKLGIMVNLSVGVSISKPSNQPPTNLQVLKGLIIGYKDPGKYGLDRCTNLRKLGLTCFHSESALKTAQCISRLDNLHTLRLTSRGNPLNLVLSPMKDHQSLSNLYLFGGIEDHRIGNLPRNLNILTLSASRLTEDPMRVLGKLPQLRVLNLFNHSYLGQEMTCHADQNFPELRVLKLWILGKLELLTVENGAVPQLRELEIRVCEKIRSSEGLDQLPALKELILRNMPQDFVEDARRRLGNEKLSSNNCNTMHAIHRVNVHAAFGGTTVKS
ncbi:putative disease resistance protein At1g50180 [Quercus suber]